MAGKPKKLTSIPGYVTGWIKSALVIVFSLISLQLFAQVQLERISKAERSDGLGYVVRYHLSQPVDSFTVIQPAPDLIQMELFGSNIDTTGIRMPSQAGKIQEIRLYELQNSFGVDIYLDTDVSVTSQAYLDQNRRDILLAMSNADQYDVEVFTQQFIARNWYLDINPDLLEISDPIPQTSIDPDEDYNHVKDKIKFDTIVIDPGHGGFDPGAVGYRGVYEKDVAFRISKKLGDYIEQYIPDMKVVYTRENDTYLDLKERGVLANEAEGDLFVSIHGNSFRSPSVRGTEVYFLGLHQSDASFEVMKRENTVFNTEGKQFIELSEEDLMVYELAHSGFLATSEKIASMIDYQFEHRARRSSRGVKQAGFQVLYEASMPAVLVEVGFLSNPSELNFLTTEEGESIIASAIFRAIRDYKVEYEQTLELSSSN
ncbi:MAG: N-acetylmuramoyl-L-alanine amidase [Balneolales bacterium]|nr:N-acetylmuramoyl-L-alanine amidase [Balneolales bacterium]